jgi:hypothetical protein
LIIPRGAEEARLRINLSEHEFPSCQVMLLTTDGRDVFTLDWGLLFSRLFSGSPGAQRRQAVAPLVRAVTTRQRFTRREAPAHLQEWIERRKNNFLRGECRAFGAQVRVGLFLRSDERSYFLMTTLQLRSFLCPERAAEISRR